VRLLCLVVVGSLATVAIATAQTLDIYFIDVEGGEATLIVTPSRQAMLIDTGWDGFANRDPERIVAAARDARVERLDYLLITHFHRDHAGGAVEVARRLPVRTFVDYGEPVEQDAFAQVPFAAYAAVRASGTHRRPLPGETITLGAAEIDIVSVGGAVISRPLPGASGERNTRCAAEKSRAEPVGENPRSMGIRLRFGRFTFVDLGDLAGANFFSLACPTNRIGDADVYLVPHHGNADTAVPAFITAISPRVAILNNGVTKGGSAAGFDALRSAKTIEDVWQLHRTRNEGAVNFPDVFIANLDEGEKDVGAWLKVSAADDGSFTVTNGRTGFTKPYR
jgi:beta-lactamase superfamily II metal-dependent hydrolase